MKLFDATFNISVNKKDRWQKKTDPRSIVKIKSNKNDMFSIPFDKTAVCISDMTIC